MTDKQALIEKIAADINQALNGMFVSSPSTALEASRIAAAIAYGVIHSEVIEVLERECYLRAKETSEVEQILGKALGYPPYYPDVSDVDDGSVCTGEHVPLTLADEAADRIKSLAVRVLDAECRAAQAEERMKKLEKKPSTENEELTLDLALKEWRRFIIEEWDTVPQFMKNATLYESVETLRTGKSPDGTRLTPEQLEIYQEVVDFARSKGVIQ